MRSFLFHSFFIFVSFFFILFSFIKVFYITFQNQKHFEKFKKEEKNFSQRFSFRKSQKKERKKDNKFSFRRKIFFDLINFITKKISKIIISKTITIIFVTIKQYLIILKSKINFKIIIKK